MTELNKYIELKTFIKEMKVEHGCVGLMMSTEEGDSLEAIDFVNNRLLDGVLPLNMKIGGPTAQTDIYEALKMGVSGIIAPMVETPFGVVQFVTAMRKIAGEKLMSKLLVGINLESVTAYNQIDEILKTPEINDVDDIVVGTSDLAKSVSKPRNDPVVIKMVTKIAQKSKKEGKIVRIGGMIDLIYDEPKVLMDLLEATNADKLNTSMVCFSTDKVSDLRSACLKAMKYEKKYYAFQFEKYLKMTSKYENLISAMEKKISRIREEPSA
jgi:hypothetical protein